jgi:hypothetical protein
MVGMIDSVQQGSAPVTRARKGAAGSGRTPPASPMPPIGGWRLMEAATALCRSAVEIYRNGGEALQTAIDNSLHRLSPAAVAQPALRPDAWLTLQMLAALDDRSDLQLTGQKTGWAAREPVPRQIIEDTLQGGKEAAHDRDWRVNLDFQRDVASSRCYLRDGSWAPVLPCDLQYLRVILAVKPPFSKETFAAYHRDWLKVRGEGPIPTETECMAEAEARFSGKIIRRDIRDVRHDATPDLKRGPTGPRIRRN